MKYLIPSATLLLILSLTHHALASKEGDMSLSVNAVPLRVIDGDTFEATARVWPDIFIKTAVRPRGLDTPELRGKCEAEKELAQRAREKAEEILEGSTVVLFDIEKGKYAGRIVADVFVRKGGRLIDFAETMIRDDLGRHYDGGKRESWCE